MSDEDALHKRGHALEDEYFRKKDREMMEKIRQAAAGGAGAQGPGPQGRA